MAAYWKKRFHEASSQLNATTVRPRPRRAPRARQHATALSLSRAALSVSVSVSCIRRCIQRQPPHQRAPDASQRPPRAQEENQQLLGAMDAAGLDVPEPVRLARPIPPSTAPAPPAAGAGGFRPASAPTLRPLSALPGRRPATQQRVPGGGELAGILQDSPPPSPPLPPPSRTNWTRLVPPSVLTGHVWSSRRRRSATSSPWRPSCPRRPARRAPASRRARGLVSSRPRARAPPSARARRPQPEARAPRAAEGSTSEGLASCPRPRRRVGVSGSRGHAGGGFWPRAGREAASDPAAAGRRRGGVLGGGGLSAALCLMCAIS